MVNRLLCEVPHGVFIFALRFSPYLLPSFFFLFLPSLLPMDREGKSVFVPPLHGLDVLETPLSSAVSPSVSAGREANSSPSDPNSGAQDSHLAGDEPSRSSVVSLPESDTQAQRPSVTGPPGPPDRSEGSTPSSSLPGSFDCGRSRNPEAGQAPHSADRGYPSDPGLAGFNVNAVPFQAGT